VIIMDDRFRDNSLFPDLGPLYTGKEDADIDKRYQRHETLEGVTISRVRTVEVLNYLSAELNAEKYQIRTPEQQAQWTEMKTTNTRNIARYLLRLRCVMKDLLTVCEVQSPDKLFGQFSVRDGKDIIDYSDDSCAIIGVMLRDYLNGTSKYNIVELADIVVEKYNLSYAIFTRKSCLSMMKVFNEAKKEHESAISQCTPGQNLSLMHDYGDGRSLDKVKQLESESGIDWATISTLMRSVRILYTSSEQLKERLVSTNLRSCLRAAMNHYHAVGGSKNVNFDEKDLITEASMGLMHAADMYVHGTSARFTTYAENWIRLKVTRYTKDNNPVRVPVHVTDLVYTILKELREHGRDGNGDVSLTRQDVEKRIKKKVNLSVWQVALNRFEGRSLAVSCVTNEGDSETIAFDMFTDNADKAEEAYVRMDAMRIMDVAESLIKDGVTSKDKDHITREQFMFLKLSFIEDLKNPEIAQKCGGSVDGVNEFGKKVDSKYVRTEISRAIERIKKSMGV
jgi:RNA polymerase sigma factor (sigma-70 family)